MAGKHPSRLQGEKAHSSKPYERRKSLVQTVKELLLPSWLASWNTPLVTEEEAEALWPQEEDEEEEVATEATAPKRPRTDHQAPFSFAEPQVVREELSGPQSLLNGDSHSERSEASGSTSGCSSLGGPEREFGASPDLRPARHDWSHTRDFGVMANLPASGSLNRTLTPSGNSHGRVGIVESSTPQQPVTPRWRIPQQTATRSQGPSFSLSAFGAPVSTVDRDNRRLQSPFYPGRTTWGGASAYNRFRLTTPSAPKAETPVTVQLRERRRPPEEEGLPDCMSNATRQILSTLERMASPLSEAKKVPLDRGSGYSLLSYMPPSQRRRTPFQRSSPVPGPPTGLRARPVVSRLARNLDPVVSAARKTAPVACAPQDSLQGDQGSENPLAAQPPRPAPELRVATPDDAPVPAPVPAPSTSRASYPSSNSDRGGGKVSRTRVIHSSRKPELDFEDAPPPPDLPDLPLPVTSLPSFTFRLPAPAPAMAHTVKPTAVKPAAVEPAAVEPAAVKPTAVKPAAVKAASVPTELPVETLDEFAFSQPPSLASANTVSTSTQEFSFGVPVEVIDSQPGSQPDNAGRNEVDAGTAAPSGPARPASHLVLGGSVMDVLGRKDKDVPSDAKSTENSGVSKDVAPKSGNSLDKVDAPTPPTAPQDLWEKFKPKAGSWSCSECFVNNTASAAKCVSCETLRPGAPSAAPPAVSAAVSAPGPVMTTGSAQGTSKGFGDLFKPSATSWECEACMVRNDAKASRCCACETPRASTAQAVTSKGFADVFKPPATSWECDTCMVRNDAKASRCCACETPRASAAPGPTGTFKFGTPTSVPATSAQTQAPATFRFGNLTAASTSAATSFKFGTQETSATAVSLPAAQSATPFRFGTQETSSTAAPPVAQFKFGSAMLACKPQGPPGQDAATVFGQKTEEAAAKPVVSASGTTVATESSKVAPTFSFGTPKTEASVSSAGFSFCTSSIAPQQKTDATANVTEIKDAPASNTAAGSGGMRDSGLLAALSKATASLPSTTAPSLGGLTPLGVVPKAADPVVTVSAQPKPTADSNKGGFSFDKLVKDPPPATFAFGLPSKPTESGALKASANAPEVKTPASLGGFAFGAATKTTEGEPLKAAGASTFSFGAAQVAKSEGFAFNAPTPKPASTFSFGNAGAQAGNTATPKTAQSTFSFGNAPAQSSTVGDSTGSAAPSTPKFVFGQKTDTSPGTFTFGTASVAPTPSPSFGFPTASAAAAQPVVSQGSFGDAKRKPPAGGFKFGASQEGSTFAADAGPPLPSAQFSFGAATQPAVGAGFSFGAAQPASNQATAPAFSFGGGAPAATPAAPRVDFAAPAASPFGAPVQPQPAPVFAFGAAQMATPAPAAPQAASFQFGQSAPNQGGVFRFGAASQNAPESGTQPQPGGFNFSAAQPPALGAFGQQQPGASPAQGGFNFNAAVPANPPAFPFLPGADNPFSATGTGGATQARRIRKAIRRKPNQPR